MTVNSVHRLRSSEERLEAAKSSLKCLELLAREYDNGEYLVSREMATIVYRLVVDELERDLKFISHLILENEGNLAVQYRSTIFKIQNYIDEKGFFEVTHIPLKDDFGNKFGIMAKFETSLEEWWNTPMVIGGCCEGSLIPLKKEEQIPYKDRLRWTRRDMVKLLRDISGAHFDKSIKQRDKHIENTSLGNMVVEIPYNDFIYNSEINVDKFVFKNMQIDAIVRHIVYELISSAKQLWKI